MYCNVQGGAEALAQAGDEAWRMPLGAAVLSVRHIGLSGWSQAECAALENELTSWQQAGKLQERDRALRYRAAGGGTNQSQSSLAQVRGTMRHRADAPISKTAGDCCFA